jgi:peptide/nickel transport system substrate-binding protein
MKRTLIVFAALCGFLFSFCSDKKHKNTSEARGGIYVGGVLRVNEVENIKSLLPIAINEVNNYHIASQVYEGLVKYNQNDLSIMPALAHSWEVSQDQTEFTFHIRTDACFHDDSCFKDGIGRKVRAADVKYCFESLCSRNINNTQYDVTFKDRVEGADEFFAESRSGKVRHLSGLTIVDDSTIRIKLVNPDANFLNVLTMPGCYIYPREAVSKYGAGMRLKCVGTGPFYIETIKEGEAVIMKRNKNYWGTDTNGNQLPYLDGIKWTFLHDKKTEVLEFKRGNLDMIYHIPVELFHELMGEMQGTDRPTINFDIYSSPALATHYLGFNLQTNPFFSIREVRLAFNLAIDRHKIAEYTIQGEGRSADFGMVPYTETFEKKGYNYKALKGYTYNPDSARKLLAIAGYPEGKGLPDFNLEINSGGGDRNILIAVVVQKMLKENIGVNVTMNVVSWPEHIENVQSGKSDFFRYAWVSDYADPESFLTLFYGKHVPENYTDKSYINFCRFRNHDFDSLYMAARMEPDTWKRYRLLSAAENILLHEAPFMPLFYDENFRLEKKYVRNLPENPLNYMDMSTTYLVPDKKNPGNKK